jgi:tRNA-dihydrouridine synthase 2
MKEVQLRREELESEPNAKRMKLDDGTIEAKIAFIRSNFLKDVDLPKSILHTHTKKKLRTVPSYRTERDGQVFRAFLTLHNKTYSSSFWEKNKKNAEQGAALVCLLHLGMIKREDLIENGSLSLYEV